MDFIYIYITSTEPILLAGAFGFGAFCLQNVSSTGKYITVLAAEYELCVDDILHFVSYPVIWLTCYFRFGSCQYLNLWMVHAFCYICACNDFHCNNTLWEVTACGETRDFQALGKHRSFSQELLKIWCFSCSFWFFMSDCGPGCNCGMVGCKWHMWEPFDLYSHCSIFPLLEQILTVSTPISWYKGQDLPFEW